MKPLAKKYLELLCGTPLFKGFSHKELALLLSKLACGIKAYQKGEVLLMAGFGTAQIGVLLEGEIEAVKGTSSGGELTMSRMKAGGVFGDVLSGSSRRSPVTVTAAEPCIVLGIPYSSLEENENSSGLHIRFLKNLISVISEKYFVLDKRIDLLLIKSLRSRIATYLMDLHVKTGSSSFSTPYGRAALAGYIGCERSALSREISRMINENIITARKRDFCILDISKLKSYI